jgi:hypothetical protein
VIIDASGIGNFSGLAVIYEVSSRAIGMTHGGEKYLLAFYGEA